MDRPHLQCPGQHDDRPNCEKPTDLDLAGGLTCAYDAWNRLTEVKQGQTVVAIYEYDGLNRRFRPNPVGSRGSGQRMTHKW